MDHTLRHTLSKKERLKSRTLIERLFAEGKSLFVFPLKLIYLQIDSEKEETIPYIFGVTVPKRIHKKSSVRNLLKRRIREAYRQNKPTSFIKEGVIQKYALMYILVDQNVSEYNTIERSLRKLNQKFSQKERNIDSNV